MPYLPSDAHGKTRKANTGKRSRQWVAVYESSVSRGDDEGTAITKANGVVKKNWKKTNPKGRKPVDHRPAEMKTAGATSLQASEYEGFLKAAGLRRVGRLTAAMRKGKPVGKALERAQGKVDRRAAHFWGDLRPGAEMTAARAVSGSPLSVRTNADAYRETVRKGMGRKVAV